MKASMGAVLGKPRQAYYETRAFIITILRIPGCNSGLHNLGEMEAHF